MCGSYLHKFQWMNFDTGEPLKSNVAKVVQRLFQTSMPRKRNSNHCHVRCHTRPQQISPGLISAFCFFVTIFWLFLQHLQYSNHLWCHIGHHCTNDLFIYLFTHHFKNQSCLKSVGQKEKIETVKRLNYSHQITTVNTIKHENNAHAESNAKE